jgi:hypothetical protein
LTTDWKSSVSAEPQTTIITDINNYIEDKADNCSAIDLFYSGRNELVTALTPKICTEHPFMAALSLVGLISITENYFRDILSDIIRICPLAKEKSAERPLNLATVWFGSEKIEKGAFENISFSNKAEIIKNLKNVIDFDVKSSNQILTPLENFGSLCELRHSIVHSAGILSGKNAIKLHLANSHSASKVKINFAEFHESAGICTSLVQSTNQELFEHMTKRWLHKWSETSAYRNENRFQLFKKVWLAFFSEADQRLNRISSPMSAIKAKNHIDRAHISRRNIR